MLTHVDVFLGGAVVMLAVSLLVTIVTQIVSFLFNLRGEQLRKGLAELFSELGAGTASAKLATRILTHPLLADGMGAKRLVPAISKVDLKSLLGNAETLLKDVPVEEDKLKAVVAGVDVWFDATVSKVSHRFTMQTRFVTIIGSVLAAFILQLDAFGLVSRLYADSDLRTRLAGAADSMVTQSERILAKPSVFADAAGILLTEKTGALKAPAAPIASREQAEAWIESAVADPKDAAPFAARYDVILQTSFTPAIKSWLGDAAAIKDQLAASGFQLVPHPYRPYGDIWLLLGVLTSAALLSLGAPFWFNALKTASNLRPALAEAVQTRDDADKAT